MEAKRMRELMYGKTKEELIAIAKKHHLSQYVGAPPYDKPAYIVITQSGGSITDADGNTFLEANDGGGGATVGRDNPYIIEAIIKTLKTNPMISTGKPTTPVEILFTEKVASHMPGSLNKVSFGHSGSDANESAIKAARQYWKLKGQGTKYKVISRWWDYVGATLGASSAAGYPFRRTPYEPLLAGFIHNNPPYCYRCVYGKTYPDCNLECAEEFRRTIEYEDPSTIACWIGDLVITALANKPGPPEYVKRIREICDEYNILMIVDEVKTGWGRMGTWTASEYYGIVPDIITLGKGISGVYLPLSAVVLKDEIASVFTGKDKARDVLHILFTASGNAPCVAAGLAYTEFVERENILDRVKERSGWIASELKKLEQDFKCVAYTNHVGMIWGIELVKDKKTKQLFPNINAVKEEILSAGFKNGVRFMLFLADFGTLLLSNPSLTCTDEELELVFHATREALAAVEQKFL